MTDTPQPIGPSTSRGWHAWAIAASVCVAGFVIIVALLAAAAAIAPDTKSTVASTTTQPLTTTTAENHETVAATSKETTSTTSRRPTTSTTASAEPTRTEQEFLAALEEGAGCAELYDIRNAADPNDDAVVRMNDELQRVGCMAATSRRSDLAGEPTFELTQMRLGWDSCAHDPDAVFAESGTTDPAAAAEWYGEGLKEPYRTPSVEGCFRALVHEPRP